MVLELENTQLCTIKWHRLYIRWFSNWETHDFVEHTLIFKLETLHLECPGQRFRV